MPLFFSMKNRFDTQTKNRNPQADGRFGRGAVFHGRLFAVQFKPRNRAVVRFVAQPRAHRSFAERRTVICFVCQANQRLAFCFAFRRLIHDVRLFSRQTICFANRFKTLTRRYVVFALESALCRLANSDTVCVAHRIVSCPTTCRQCRKTYVQYQKDKHERCFIFS